MRALRLIVTIVAALIAVIGGLVAAAIAVVTALGFLLSRRVFGHSERAAAVPRAHPRASRMKDSEAIEVTATEVPVETTLRE